MSYCIDKTVKARMEQVFMSHSTQNMLFRRRSSQTISWLGTEKTQPNKTNNTKPKWLKLTQKHTKLQTKPLQKMTITNLALTKYKFKNRSYLCAYWRAQLVTWDSLHFSAFSVSTGVQDLPYTAVRSPDQDQQSGRVLTLRALTPPHTSVR